MFKRRFLPLALFLLLLLVPHASAGSTAISGVGVFFYPWYGHWYHWGGPANSSFSPPLNWTSHYIPEVIPDAYIPDIELYESNDSRVILWQLYEMRLAHVSYGISSWWGRGRYEDRVFEMLLNLTESPISPHPRMKWCIIYEPEGYADPSEEKIEADISYILQKYGWRPSYLKVNGRPVIFVYSDYNDGVEYAEKWHNVEKHFNNSVFFVLKVFPGYREYSEYADSWFQYAPALRIEFQKPYSGFVSPGFWKLWKGDYPPVLKRDPADFKRALKELVNSNVQIKTIQTWNEWHEGTQIEPGQKVVSIGGRYYPLESYGSLYVDMLADVVPSPYQYEPRIELKPDLLINESTFVQVIGWGFRPGSEVKFLVDGKTLIASTRAGEAGSFIWDLPPDSFPSGFHVLVVSDGNLSSVAPLYKPLAKVIHVERTVTETQYKTITFSNSHEKPTASQTPKTNSGGIIIIAGMLVMCLILQILWKVKKR